MKNKNTINLVLSAFLVTAFVVCTYFFSTLGLTGTAQSAVNALVTVVFGLILFYATRVGEGKAVRRFSVATLIILDLPALYIILTSLATALPLGDVFGSSPIVIYLAGVALGYGIPYTFLSGFEIITDEDSDNPVQGGIMEELDPEEGYEEADENDENIESADEEIKSAAEETAEDDDADDSETPAVEINC